MKKMLILLVAALSLSAVTMSAQTARTKAAKATTVKKAKSATAKKASGTIDINTFNGTWANRYPDGVGGTVTDYLTIKVDESGAVTAQYIDESGDTRNFTGTVKSGVMTLLDGDGDEFATAKLLDGNTIKLEGFTGTFKRVKDTNELPETDKYNTNVESAPVDPAFEQVKKHLEDK